MSIQEHFAKYWELGWVAFPISLSWNISKNKKDLNPPKDWQKLDVESAKLLSPKGAIALQTGPLSGIVVVDIDDVEAWQKFLVDKGQDAPKTVTARSQRGGLHFYFRWTEELGDLKSTSALLRGCADIRSTGGMIIAPPSSFQVPGEHDRRRYTWIEGKAPWDRWLADMPLWLAQALRKSLAVHHNGKTQGVKSTAVLDGPDMAPTPDTVKSYIAQHYGVLTLYIGGTKWLGDKEGYAISTTMLDCMFKMEPHKSNRQYFYVSFDGNMSRCCHDGDCCEKKWGPRKIPVDLIRALEALFPCQPALDAELIDDACQEAVSLVNDVHPRNEGMTMVHKRTAHAFEGPLESYFGRKACLLCGRGRLVAITNREGLSIQCDDVQCGYQSPPIGATPIPVERYKRLGKFYIHVKQQINVTVSAGPSASWIDFANESHAFIPEDDDLNRSLLYALSGIHESVAKFVAKVAPNEVAFVDHSWWSFENHRWIETSESEAIEKTIGASAVYEYFGRAFEYYQQEARTHPDQSGIVQKAKWVRETLTQLGKTPYRKKSWINSKLTTDESVESLLIFGILSGLSFLE